MRASIHSGHSLWGLIKRCTESYTAAFLSGLIGTCELYGDEHGEMQRMLMQCDSSDPYILRKRQRGLFIVSGLPSRGAELPVEYPDTPKRYFPAIESARNKEVGLFLGEIWKAPLFLAGNCFSLVFPTRQKKRVNMPNYRRTCPSKCSGSGYDRQYDLTEGLFKKLSLSAQQAVLASTDQATRCSYCGCVYLYSSAGSKRIGHLDGSVTGQGWKSGMYP